MSVISVWTGASKIVDMFKTCYNGATCCSLNSGYTSSSCGLRRLSSAQQYTCGYTETGAGQQREFRKMCSWQPHLKIGKDMPQTKKIIN